MKFYVFHVGNNTVMDEHKAIIIDYYLAIKKAKKDK